MAKEIIPEYAWTERRYDEGLWCITEVTEINGKVEEYDWCFYKRSMATRIEAVAEILDHYPNAKFDSWMDEWYISRKYDYQHYFVIWDSAIYGGPWGPKWDELVDENIEDDYDFYEDEEDL